MTVLLVLQVKIIVYCVEDTSLSNFLIFQSNVAIINIVLLNWVTNLKIPGQSGQ